MLSGLIGAVIGGAMSMRAATKRTKQQFEFSRNLQDETDREATGRFLLAIKTEVTTIWTGYEHEVGHRVAAAKGLIDTRLVNNDLLEAVNKVTVTVYGSVTESIALDQQK